MLKCQQLLPDNLYDLFQIIYIARNPKDVAVSLYYFTLSFKPITRYDGKFEDFCNLFIEDKGKVSFMEVNSDSLAKLLITKIVIFSLPIIGPCVFCGLRTIQAQTSLGIWAV